MMRQTHWYLRNWEYEEAKEGKQAKMVYTGEYYTLRNRALTGRLKAAYLVFTVLLWILLLLMLSNISRGASLIFVGGAVGISMFPAIYLSIGAFRFLFVPERMTYRDLRASLYRIKMAAKWVLAFQGIAFCGELFYLGFRMFHGLAIAWAEESTWILGTAGGFLLMLGTLFLYRIDPEELCPVNQSRGELSWKK